MTDGSSKKEVAPTDPLAINCRDERKFLHDIASPIGTALFLIDGAIDTFKAIEGIPPDDLAQLQLILDSLMRVKDMMQARRKVLIDLEDTHSKS